MYVVGFPSTKCCSMWPDQGYNLRPQGVRNPPPLFFLLGHAGDIETFDSCTVMQTNHKQTNNNNLWFSCEKKKRYNLRTQTRGTLLTYCTYVQWVPDSDVVVAQNRGALCVWYNIHAPDQARTARRIPNENKTLSPNPNPGPSPPAVISLLVCPSYA